MVDCSTSMGQWTYGTLIDNGDHNHHDKSCEILVAKTGQLITRSSWHGMTTPITAEQCLGDQLSKDTKMDPSDDILMTYEQKLQHENNNSTLHEY